MLAFIAIKRGTAFRIMLKPSLRSSFEPSVIGDNINDEDRVIFLLASLPEMLVTALEANAKVPDMETVIECLLHEEQKMKEKTDQGSSQTGENKEAMAVKNKKRGPRCHFCNKFGHTAKLS